MSTTSQLTTFSDKHCFRCKSFKPVSSFRQHAWCRDCQKSYNLMHKSKIKATYEQNRRRRLKTKFNITESQYAEILKSQNGRCAICQIDRNANFKSFVVDHDHSNGKVRGLLCMNCNTAIGQFRESIDNLMRAADYIARHQ